MGMYEASVPQFKKMLANVDKWLQAAETYAKSKSFDVNVLLTARLAPDQYALVRQVQSCCDSAKFPAARLAAKEPPKHPDTEQTFEELHARIRACTSFLDSIKPADFEGAATRKIELPFLEGKLMTGANYLNEMALPNFYFHITTTYSILRNNGVPLGKMDFIGPITLQDK